MGVWPWLWPWTPLPRPTLPALGAVPLPASLLAAYEALVVVVPLLSHQQPWYSRVSRSRQRHFLASWSRSSHRPSVKPFCCLVSITAWSSRCLAIMLNNASGSCVTISKRIIFSTLRQLEWLDSRRYCLNQHLAMVNCRPSGLTTSVSPLSARYCRRARFCMNTLLSISTPASIFGTRNIWRH